MDSLLANYASSDDEEDKEDSQPSSSISIKLPPPKSKPSLFSSPKTLTSSSSSALFSSLPPPKSLQTNPPVPSPAPKIGQSNPNELTNHRKPIFSSLPPPKSQPSNPQNPKKVIQFTLPLNPSLLKPSDLDEEDEQEERKPIKDFSTPSKGLSSMLPAPKHSLCLAPSAASRRFAFESAVSSPNLESFENREENTQVESFESGEQERGNFEENGSYPSEQGANDYVNYVSYEGNWAANEYAGSSYETSYTSGGGDHGTSYASNWDDGNAAPMAAQLVLPEMERFAGKRGRNEIPTEIVEVNQAELMKNRPRADQAKATGIAFGPAYQPVSTSKGKPSKLHKRKHQIGSLYFDMKQKETELAERRSKGFLTKAETQAKYGW